MAKAKQPTKLAPETATTTQIEKEGPQQPPGQERVYPNQKEIDSDCFVLELSESVRDISWSDVPDWEKVPHVHFYHTVDSSGKRLNQCAPVGGHFHVMTLTPQPDGVPLVECSGPKKLVRKIVQGQHITEVVPFNAKDKHTHEVRYRNSQRIKVREANVEAAKLTSMIMAKENQTLPGVQG